MSPTERQRGNPQPTFQFDLRRLFWILLVISFVVALFANLPTILHWLYHQWEVGSQFDQRTYDACRFKLRVTAFHQRGAFMAARGAFYQYEVKTRSSWSWKTIVMFRFSAPDPIPKDQFEQVTDSSAFFYHEHVYGVTTDFGESWTIKGAEDAPPICTSLNFDRTIRIDHVSIDSDATGVMQLTQFQHLEEMTRHTLTTSDFGKEWKVK